MNEAAGMSQTLPLYLIVVGGILIVALVVLLVKMRGGKDARKTTAPEERPAERKTAHREETGRPTVESTPVDEAPPTENKTRRKEPERDVSRDPFEETAGIGRESFERFAGNRVLVVEDNPVNRKLIMTLMAGSGIELDAAEDGIKALEKLRAPDAAFDLVLMDVNMPGMDGLECTREIRNDPKLNTLPVLALTASTTPEEVDAILACGMNGYLDKPLELGKLYTAFVRFMPAPRRERRPEGPSDSPKETENREVLDSGVGLEHTNDDPGLYKMLLEDFLQQYGTSPEKFREMVSAKDLDGLHRLIIDLEGLTGTLGAMELYRLVRDIDQVVERSATMLLTDYAEEYGEAFERLRAEIERYLKSV